MIHQHISHSLSYSPDGSTCCEVSPDSAFRIPIWGKGDHRGSEMVPFERVMVVSYMLSIVTIAISPTIRPQFAIEYLRCSNHQRLGHFGAKFREEGVHKLNFSTIQDRWAVICKINCADIFCRLGTVHNVTRQTDHGTVTSIPIGESAFSDVAWQ